MKITKRRLRQIIKEEKCSLLSETIVDTGLFDAAVKNAVKEIAPPKLEGSANAEVTLIGWGSTYGVIKEAVTQLAAKGVTANHLPIKWIVPFHVEAVTEILSNAKRTIIVENNYSGQFYRYLRSETGLNVDGHIRKYDGEPFAPHHIVDAVQEQLAGNADYSVPTQEIMV